VWWKALAARRLLGHPTYVWLIWIAVVVGLVVGPVMLTDPAIWLYLVDPELLALVVVVAIRYGRIELALTAHRMRQLRRRRRAATSSARALSSPDGGPGEA
jgi:hypothetical protein